MYLKQEHYKNIKTTIPPYTIYQATVSTYTLLYDSPAKHPLQAAEKHFPRTINAAGCAAMYFIIRNLIDNFVLPTFSGYSISALFSNVLQCMRLQIIIMYMYGLICQKFISKIGRRLQSWNNFWCR